MRPAVIRPALRAGGDHQRLAGLRHHQGARHVRDIVVRRDVVLAILHDGCTCRVVAGTLFRLASRYGYALNSVRPLQPRRRGVLPAVIRQRGAVIFLLVAVCRDRQCLFRYFERSVCISDFIAFCYVIAGCVFDHRCRRHVI